MFAMGPRRSGREIPGDFAYMVAMLDTLRDFVRRLGAHETEVHFSADDTRLAVAALLVHSMTIDGVASDVERAKLEDLLSRKFGLSGADLELLVKDATDAENEANVINGAGKIPSASVHNAVAHKATRTPTGVGVKSAAASPGSRIYMATKIFK